MSHWSPPIWLLSPCIHPALPLGSAPWSCAVICLCTHAHLWSYCVRCSLHFKANAFQLQNIILNYYHWKFRILFLFLEPLSDVGPSWSILIFPLFFIPTIHLLFFYLFIFLYLDSSNINTIFLKICFLYLAFLQVHLFILPPTTLSLSFFFHFLPFGYFLPH